MYGHAPPQGPAPPYPYPPVVPSAPTQWGYDALQMHIEALRAHIVNQLPQQSPNFPLQPPTIPYQTPFHPRALDPSYESRQLRGKEIKGYRAAGILPITILSLTKSELHDAVSKVKLISKNDTAETNGEPEGKEARVNNEEIVLDMEDDKQGQEEVLRVPHLLIGVEERWRGSKSGVPEVCLGDFVNFLGGRRDDEGDCDAEFTAMREILEETGQLLDNVQERIYFRYQL